MKLGVRFCGAALALWVAVAAAPAGSAPTDPAAAPAASAGARVLDDFESIDAWSPHPAEGVNVVLSSDAGAHGRALRVDFDFVRGGGYAVIRRALDLDLAENYAFDFTVRGECLPNDLEFKLIDASGENVWWMNRRGFEFPTTWKTLHTRQRQISFAWGPVGGGVMQHVAALEIAITAGKGGKGTVWLDDLAIRALPPDEPAVSVSARASSAAAGHGAAMAIDSDSMSVWRGGAADRAPWLAIDFGAAREFGGLVVDWRAGGHPVDYAVETSFDGTAWERVRTVRGGDGGRDHLWLPETEARFVRLRALAGVPHGGIAVSNVAVKPIDWAATAEDFFAAVARDAPRGDYPRGISGEQSYWTVVGADGAADEALVGEDGAIEAGKGGFSVEPFLYADGRLWTWADVVAEQSLDGGTHVTHPYLDRGDNPIPNVRWTVDSLQLTVTACATGRRDSSAVWARYVIVNRSFRRRDVRLYLAVRPFQVDPPTQFLNGRGGTSPIRSITRDGGIVQVNSDHGVVLMTAPDVFGATTFDAGNIIESLRHGAVPPRKAVRDTFGFAAGAMGYQFTLGPGSWGATAIAIPLVGPPRRFDDTSTGDLALRAFDNALDVARADWVQRLDGFALSLPGGGLEVARTLRAQLAYILINRDGPAIQPGSRSYERSWIRDGALTSSALLRLGHTQEVREYLEWFAAHQFDNGKVPCCVDQRGPDPVPEHDSSGELIFLVAEYLRLGGERAVVERLWPNVQAAATYLDSLRHLRRTPEYRETGRRQFYGLLPPSISHEGYSAKPMHSYWDDLFALRGFRDAAFIAASLDRADDASRWAKVGDEFARDLNASIREAQRVHHIDFMPGCADLGDFDATSTTIALSPVQTDGAVPEDALRATFKRYWSFFVARRDGVEPWDAYTPYELRNVGAFVHLGWRERANELLAWFMNDRRPPGWAHWAEVVGHDPRKPRFIGDMPHTWVGSDFIRSVLDMIAYERERDDALVLAAGVPEAWVREGEGLSVRGLVTRYGRLDFSLREEGGAMVARIDGVTVPRGGIVLVAPEVKPGSKATINGRPVTVSPAGEVVVRRVPAEVRIAK